MINKTEKVGNLIKPKLSYAIRKLCTHSSTSVRTWDSKQISRKQPKKEP